MSAVVCKNVTQHFGDLTALDSVSLEVSTGEIFGIIGPNGAGKTTLLNRMEGLATPTSGSIKVLDLDPQARLALWDVVHDIRDGGTTVVLTTHYMEEAESLSELAGVTSVERGRSTTGTPTATVRGTGALRVLEHLSGCGVAVSVMSTTAPSLEDVFLNLTGRSIREDR